MHQNAAVFLLITLSLLAANAPFLLDRPLLVVPWARQGVGGCPAGMRWVFAVALPAALAGLAWYAQVWIGQAVAGGGVQALWFFLHVLSVVAVAALLLAAPAWVVGKAAFKPVWHRLLEFLVLYALVGSLGFALEANQGGIFPQRWEFYAVTFSLFLVMAYPGFVARYLLRRGARPRRVRDTTRHDNL